jgi:SAM-dependent methyltransferase
VESVREHFRKKASSFDDLYAEDRRFQRLLRPGLFARRELAAAVAGEFENPRVLDVGCGSGRVGEDVLEGGAAEYVGIDFSEPMLALAERRLERFGDRVRLVAADFLSAELDGPFEVVLGLGLFDYTPEPERFARRMHDMCSGAAVASFPRWNWLKGPVRKVRYEVLGDCPIFNYTERELRIMFGAAGFARADILPRGRTGYLVRAEA